MERSAASKIRFQLLCGALYDWLLDQGYNEQDADAILCQLIDKDDEEGKS